MPDDLKRDTLINELAAAIGDKFASLSCETLDPTLAHRAAVDAAYAVLRQHMVSDDKPREISVSQLVAAALADFDARYPQDLVGNQRQALAECMCDRIWRDLVGKEPPPGQPVLGTIKGGDVVRLRSGGPLMTAGDVQRPTELMKRAGVVSEAVSCFWHDTDGSAQSAMFPVTALERRHANQDPLVAVLNAALALWGEQLVLNGNATNYDHPFDYMQRQDGTVRINGLAMALMAVDGKRRSFVPREE